MANHVEKHLGNYDTEDSRTNKKCLCFDVCALCLSSTMESARLYMWQNPVGARRWCEGPSGGRLLRNAQVRDRYLERGGEHVR